MKNNNHLRTCPHNASKPQRYGTAFLGDTLVHLIAFADPPGHDELDHTTLVALGGHGPPQSLHGFLVGFAQQRLSIYSYQLVVHSQPSILGGKQAT